MLTTPWSTLRAWPTRLLRVWRAVIATGVLGRHPLLSLCRLAWCVGRQGGSLHALVVWHAGTRPHQRALTDPGQTLSFSALAERVAEARRHLQREHGVLHRAALLGGNQIAYVEALLACTSAGAQTVLLNTQWGPEALRDFFLGQAVDLVLHDAASADRLESVLRDLPFDVRPACRRLDSGLPVAATGIPSVRPPRRWFRRRPGPVVVWSSGTGGTPHAASSPTLAEGLDVLCGLLEGLRPRTGDATLLATPLLHGQGLVTLALSLGLGAPLSLVWRPCPEDLRACIARDAVRTIVLVPTLLHRLLATSPPMHPDVLEGLGTWVCGSAPLDPPLANQCLNRFGAVLHNLYGTTEAGLISLATPEDLRQAPGSVGRVLPGVQLRVTPSEVQGQGRLNVLRGRKDIATGDLGFVDAGGRLHLLGREDELLICGAEKVHPRLLERRISVLPYIQDLLVTGWPDTEYGQAIHLGVVLHPGNEHVTPSSIGADLKALLPRTLRPRHVRLLSAVPRTLTGKPLRKVSPHAQ